MRRSDPEVVRRRYPLSDLLPGWFFRLEEKSPGHYLAEGMDLWDRQVSVSGGDDAIDRAVAAALEIESQVRSAQQSLRERR